MSLSPEGAKGVGATTGKLRKKVVLKPGRGMLNWMKLGNSGVDLSGTNGERLEVTLEELAKHNTVDDAWMALNGYVYNVTPYMEYHPGGEPELIRGIGKDASELFKEAHHYVNDKSILKCCRIGRLVEKPKNNASKKQGAELFISSSSEQSLKSNDTALRNSECSETASSVTPRPETLAMAPRSCTHRCIRACVYVCGKTGCFKSQGSSKKLSLQGPDEMTVNSLSVALPPVFNLPGPGPPKPRYDWLQTDDTVTVIIYTNHVDFRPDQCIIDKPINTQQLKLTLFIKDYTYIIHLELEKEIGNFYKVSVSPVTGKTEVVCHKSTAGEHWSELGAPTELHGTWMETSETDIVYRSCKVISVSPVNHDTHLYKLALPAGTRMCVPLGYHVNLRVQIEGVEISKSYTVACPGLDDLRDPEQETGSVMYLMIKTYPDGVITPIINKLTIGDNLDVSNYVGDFRPSMLTGCNHVTMCAAGTGFTPMIGLIHHLLNTDPPQPDRKICLLFYNKTEKDILWRDKLELLENKHSNFSCHHILSQADDHWLSHRGRITKDHLEECIPCPGGEISPLFFACGPTPFTKQAISLAGDHGYTADMMHAFLG